ncbi:MAG: hypothetical protein IKE24_06755 [Clostridia bacterium]|nr:hypothetical protein [Clostridia bacterium]
MKEKTCIAESDFTEFGFTILGHSWIMDPPDERIENTDRYSDEFRLNWYGAPDMHESTIG